MKQLIPIVCCFGVTLGCAGAASTNETAEKVLSGTGAATVVSVSTGKPHQVVARSASLSAPKGAVYVIPVKGVIERALVYMIRRGVAQAEEEGAAAIVLDMDTPGGRVDSAEDIVNLIGGLKIPTYTLVNPNAISAGAIIAMSTDHIYMTPGSRIGDAMPIAISPLGGVEKMPESIEEKQVSYVASLIRSTAERKNHDPKLAESMVRREEAYSIGDVVVKPAKQLLTLTNKEAERKVVRDGREENLLSSGTVEDMDDLLAKIGCAAAVRKELSVSSAESIARYIEMLSFLLLIGGILGLYIEFKTPGFGLPGILGIVLLAVWFWGHHVAGLAGMGEVLLFMLGVVFVVAEVFWFPGFGIIGILGILMMVVSLIMAMVEHYPGGPIMPPVRQLGHAVQVLGLSLAGVAAAGIVLARYLPQTTLWKGLVLATEETKDKGFTTSVGAESLIGKRGNAATDLRPGGIAVIGDRRMDVVTRGLFVGKGSCVVVTEVKGSRVVVDPSDGNSAVKAG